MEWEKSANRISKARLLKILGMLSQRLFCLKSSEDGLKKFQDIIQCNFNELDDGYFELDLNGKYLFANQTACKYNGKSLKELVGTNALVGISRRSKIKLIKFFNQIYRNEVEAQFIDFEYISGDGKAIRIDLSVALMQDEKGTPVGFRGIARDRTCERLKFSELERYKEFVESIDDGCFESDLHGTLTFINKAMSAIHGYPLEELVGMNHRNLATPEESKSIYKVFNLIYKTGIPSRIFDYNIITKSGKSRNLEVSAKLICDKNGNRIGFRGISRDRSEKKKQELELARYRNFVENVDDACFEVDLAGNFIFFNDASCRVFGYPPDQLMGLNNRDYTSPETSKKIYNIFNKIFKTGRPADVFDYEIKRGDGQKRFLDMSASLICDAKGTPIGFRGICRDVTDQKNAQIENERLTALLNESQRLEAIATLAAGVAHNFNNLLMSIQGYVSLLGMDVTPEQPNYKRLKSIEEHIKKGSELTLQLLSYANVSYNPANRVNINDIVRSSVSVFKMTYKQIMVSEQYCEFIHDAAVDRKQIDHVMVNLFKNAVQAMPDGGELFVATENVTLSEEFVSAYERGPGSYVKITVRDTGIGMDRVTQERIFEPFFTTQSFGTATGLGLAAVYGVIKKHLGIIEVESQEKHGTTFSIYLPTKEELPIDQTITQANVINQEAILIVDDEEVFIKLMSKMIGKLGYDILSASNGHQALEIFKANKDRIDLVIMDMIMPGISGDQLIEMMQNIDKDVRVILVSGYIKDDKMKNITAHNRRAFLQKPFQREALLETIEGLMAS